LKAGKLLRPIWNVQSVYNCNCVRSKRTLTTQGKPPLKTHISCHPLEAAPNADEFRLHELAHEWSLAEPIVIESTNDVRSKVNWQEHLTPYHHQMQNLMTFCRRLPVSLIADDVGLGKTISAGLILSELMIRNRVSRALVVCPGILGEQWVEELGSKFGIIAQFATGAAKLTSALRGQIPVVVTTYHSVSPRLEHIEPGSIDMLILDEAHKVRNLYGTRNPPRIAQNIRRALDQRLFKYVAMLTATPIQNRLWDLYSIIDCLAVAKGHRNPFGTPDEFKWKYIADKSTTARQLKPGSKKQFRSILRQYLVRTRRADVRLAFPQRIVKLFEVPPSDLDSRLQSLVARNIEGMSGLQQSSLLMAMMSSPQALIAQLKNMAARDESWLTLARSVEELLNQSSPPQKISALLKVIDQLQKKNRSNWRMVVFTTRKETQRIICQALADRGIAHGTIRGGQPQKNFQAVKEFSCDPPKIHVIVSTDAGAEGVNLQAGNVIVNFDLPWNPMIVEQRIGRVQRLASKHEHVVVVNIAIAGSPERRVVVRLMEKLQTIADTVGDVEAILEASAGDDDVSSASFESNIRELVIKSLIGQDVERATAMSMQSIQEAKSLFESQRQELDKQLGNLNELHTTGPKMPHLVSLKPSVGHEEFVRAAFVADGWTYSPDDNRCAVAEKRGQPDERQVFKDAHWREHSQPGLFHGRSPKLYSPGKPAFERLVQKWLDRSGHYTSNLAPLTQRLSELVAQSWVKRIEGGRVEAVTVMESQTHFQGRSRLKVTASNSLDSYEKLIEIEHVPQNHSTVFGTASLEEHTISDQLLPEELATEFTSDCHSACESDSDIQAFCKFYLARHHEESGKADGNAESRTKIDNDLLPAIHAQPVSVTGVRYEVCRIHVTFTIDGHAGYSVEMTTCPISGQVFAEPEDWRDCAETGRSVPTECLESCDVTGSAVLSHLLVTSDETGRKALGRRALECEETGRIAFDDEFLISDLSGKRAVASFFRTSALGGRRGLPNEMVSCEFTGEDVLQDEVVRSDISHKLFRKDQSLASAVSGVAGHRSEFAICSVTQQPILPIESQTSDLSGKVARSDRMLQSERPPHRCGCPDEIVTCAVTGRKLLRDEVDVCLVTEKTVDTQLLNQSEESGRLALKEQLVTCEETKKRVLPDELVISGVSGLSVLKSICHHSAISGKYGLDHECEVCDVTGACALRTELITSDESGMRFRQDEASTSDLSGKIGHRSEVVTCEFTGRIILLSEAGQSALSGKTTAIEDLRQSEKTGRVGVDSELEFCEVTGRRLLKDEVAASEVSGRVVDKDLLTASTRSRQMALRDELIKCELSGDLLLPDDAVDCQFSGLRIARYFATPSEVSGAWCQIGKLVECSATGRKVLPSELVACELTGDLVISSSLEICVETGDKVRRDRLTQSDVSRRWLLPNKARRSFNSGKILCRDETAFCHWNEDFLAVGEAATCKRTGLTFDRRLISKKTRQFVLVRKILTHDIERQDLSELKPWFRSQVNGKLKSAEFVSGVYSRNGAYCLVKINLQSMLGLVSKNVVLFLKVSPEHKIIGRVTVSTKKPPGWKEL
jgi:superfamily II DNA or RNA helicase